MLKGRDLAPWTGAVNLNQIYLYRYSPGGSPAWTPIPFQIDKRRKINFIHNIKKSEFQALPEPLQQQLGYSCALSYFPAKHCSDWSEVDPAYPYRECPLAFGAAFQSDLLGPTDEIVFMARELGAQPDSAPFEWLGSDPGLGSTRLAIMVPDDASGDGVIGDGEKFWVYAYLWSQPPPPEMKSSAAPPTWTADPGGCTPCAAPVTGNNAHNTCGTMRGPSSATREGYETHMLSNWQYDDFRIVPKSSSTPNGDILDSWNKTAAGETNYDWDCTIVPRPMDVKVPTFGQVRVIRGIQGAASGVATMKYDKAYDSLFEMEIELRVHELDQLEDRQGHNQAVKDDGEAANWAKSARQGTDLAKWDQIDGATPSPTEPPTSTPGAYDWWQMIDSNRGGTASFLVEDALRGLVPAEDTEFFYKDMNSLPYGNFGRRWELLSCMQDGHVRNVTTNDGGCAATSDPDSPDLLFRRTSRFTIPTRLADENLPASVDAGDWEFAVVHPLISATSGLECQSGSCGGGLPTPLCTPTLATISQPDGSVKLTPNLVVGSECEPSAGSFGVTSQVAGGSESVVGYVLPGGSFRHMKTSLGVSHTYRAFAMTADGRVSAKSSPSTLTPQDVTPPPPPLIQSVHGISGGITLEYFTCLDVAIHLVKFYLSVSPGGPYTQANRSPIHVSDPHVVTLPGLPNGITFYGVATMVDLAGNESVYSPEFTVTTGP